MTQRVGARTPFGVGGHRDVEAGFRDVELARLEDAGARDREQGVAGERRRHVDDRGRLWRDGFVADRDRQPVGRVWTSVGAVPSDIEAGGALGSGVFVGDDDAVIPPVEAWCEVCSPIRTGGDVTAEDWLVDDVVVKRPVAAVLEPVVDPVLADDGPVQALDGQGLAIRRDARDRDRDGHLVVAADDSGGFNADQRLGSEDRKRGGVLNDATTGLE